MPREKSAGLLEGPYADLLIEAVGTWAHKHPLRDRPLLDMGGEFEPGLTPEDIAAALRDPHHPAHRVVVHLFEVGLSGYEGPQEELVVQLIDAFTGKTQP
ncbi:MAG: hypothetical protein ACLPXZ_20620 [Mycobacterium sp.]